MSYRGVLGPVYAFEWLTASRRWQMYAGRALFVGLLLLGLGFYWIAHTPQTDWNTIKGQAAIGRGLHSTLVSLSLLMVLLAAPAATAGAICLDKARGALLHVLVTDLSDSEIVLGKLAARLVPVVGLIGSSLPVLAISDLARRGRSRGAERLLPGGAEPGRARLHSDLDAFRLGKEDT